MATNRLKKQTNPNSLANLVPLTREARVKGGKVTAEARAKGRLLHLLGRRAGELEKVSTKQLRSQLAYLLSDSVTLDELKAIANNPETGVCEALAVAAVRAALKKGDPDSIARVVELATGENMLSPANNIQVNIQNNIQRTEYSFADIDTDTLCDIADRLQDGRQKRGHIEELAES